MKTSNLATKVASKLGVFGAAGILASAGLAGFSLVNTGVASAATANTTINAPSTVETYSCIEPILGSAITATATVVGTVTAPLYNVTSLAPGSTITVSGTSTLSLPSDLASTLSEIGVSSVTVTAVSVGVDATGDVTQAAQTAVVSAVNGSSLPATLAASALSSVSATLSPLTFTAGSSSGSIAFYPGDISQTVTLGSFGSYTIPCTPVNPVELGGVSLTVATPPTTVATTVPTTVATTVATTVPTTVATTVATTVPTTVATTTPTTIKTTEGPVGTVGGILLAVIAGSGLFMWQWRRQRKAGFNS